MPVPKRRKTPSRRDMRRSANSKLEVRSPANCSRCGQPKLPHTVCPHCGYYKNQQVLEVEEGSRGGSE
ncbi:MAG: 50S ribosomal protein L32 [Deltaproteobacteria bacterium]|nr:50S ribosomal protein L32 [Deltaproteobacteria bacterium]